MYIFAGILLYVLIGIIRVWMDFSQSYHNQPGYVSKRIWGMVVKHILLWPRLVAWDLQWWFLYRFRKSNRTPTENNPKREPTGISKLRIIENELKDKKNGADQATDELNS